MTLKDVAKQAGVSTATVSHVLNNKKSVTPEVLGRVQRAIVTTGYRPNTAARALRTGHSHTFGLLVPDIANPFFSQLIKAVEARARQAGYATVLFESGYDQKEETRGLDFLETHRVDGLVWVLSGDPRPPRRRPAFPTIVVDYAPTSTWFAIRADDHEGGRLQAQHALAFGHCQAIALWGRQAVTSIQERRRGFLEAAAGQLSLVAELDVPFALELPKEAANALASLRGQYSYVVCGNDLIAIAALRALKALGVSVPDEVSVIGFDDTPLCEIVSPTLTSIAQPIGQLGSLAVDSLLQQVQDRTSPAHQLVVPVSLRPRASTGPAPHAYPEPA